MPSLGSLEREVMECLWRSTGPLSVRDVQDALPDRELAYTTVMTVLDRLGRKQLVARVRDGRAYRYTAVHGPEVLAAELMHDALESAGEARTAALVQFTEQMSPEEAAALREALARITEDS